MSQNMTQQPPRLYPSHNAFCTTNPLVDSPLDFSLLQQFYSQLLHQGLTATIGAVSHDQITSTPLFAKLMQILMQQPDHHEWQIVQPRQQPSTSPEQQQQPQTQQQQPSNPKPKQQLTHSSTNTQRPPLYSLFISRIDNQQQYEALIQLQPLLGDHGTIYTKPNQPHAFIHLMPDKNRISELTTKILELFTLPTVKTPEFPWSSLGNSTISLVK